MREEKASALPLLLDVRRMDENNRAYAYRMLRKNIMTLQLQPGCQLSEAELCEQLAMSRTPVHEALMMLKSEWLVDVLPQRGSIVSKISVPYLNEGFAMRRILEPALLRGLAGKLTREQLNEFQELLNRQNEDLYLDQDAADDFFISLDNDFHRSFVPRFRLRPHRGGLCTTVTSQYGTVCGIVARSLCRGKIVASGARKSTSRSLAICGTACRWTWT